MKVTIDIEMLHVNEDWNEVLKEKIEPLRKRLNKRLPFDKEIPEILLIEKVAIGKGYNVYYKIKEE